MKKTEPKLSIAYTRKVTLSGENSLEFEKEFIVRKAEGQYACEIKDGIRWLMFKDTSHAPTFIIVGRKMGGNKYKNYFLGSILLKDIFVEFKKAKIKVPFQENDSLDFEYIKKYLNLILENSIDKVQHFNDFVKKNYGIDYDNSTS